MKGKKKKNELVKKRRGIKERKVTEEQSTK
jgi:hypothetical protein